MQRRSFDELTTRELYAILKLRTDVFFIEQKIDDEELDNRDLEPLTEHLWMSDEEGIAAYLRVIVDDEPSHLDARHLFGRVVVRPDQRGHGLAHQLIATVLDEHPDDAFVIHSQEYIAPLYEKFGFERFGEIYVEAGLPHVMMYRASPRAKQSASALRRAARRAAS